ncbi:hypothetical protein SAMN05414137_107315 [Streptacidiphilus jiangxiensis]|uniref:Uncharacterized protein n=2 Tax=Streptacidiphilus jiangxiensis TaxID=235985 RepID=A0A1H7PDX7_STRJI|nr:hypothetical protein SAMN05414137_107315 [Streptacidiphilus jiangxiensis]
MTCLSAVYGMETPAYQHILHPTYPDSAAAQGQDPAQLMAQMLANWNTGLTALHQALTHPDQTVPLVPYGTSLAPGDLGTIPEGDLPAGLPAWMRSDEPWASRQGATPADKCATIVVQIPADQRPF